MYTVLVLGCTVENSGEVFECNANVLAILFLFETKKAKRNIMKLCTTSFLRNTVGRKDLRPLFPEKELMTFRCLTGFRSQNTVN